VDCVNRDGRKASAGVLAAVTESNVHLRTSPRELFNINRNLRNSRLSVASSSLWSSSSSSLPDIRNFKWTMTYEYSTGTSHTRREALARYRDLDNHTALFRPPAFVLESDFVRVGYLHESPFFAKRNGSARDSISSFSIHQRMRLAR